MLVNGLKMPKKVASSKLTTRVNINVVDLIMKTRERKTTTEVILMLYWKLLIYLLYNCTVFISNFM